MDVYEKNFIRAQGEAYEGTGKVPSSYDVADALTNGTTAVVDGLTGIFERSSNWQFLLILPV